MLTKNDLREIIKIIKPLKDDLSSTKADMAATKADMAATTTEIKAVNAHNSRIEMKLIDMEIKFEKNLRQWKGDLFDRIDKIIGRVKTAEEENIILQTREETRNEERQKLEIRLEKLEVLHPGNRHASI